jgi:hypothetical protein
MQAFCVSLRVAGMDFVMKSLKRLAKMFTRRRLETVYTARTHLNTTAVDDTYVYYSIVT